jgi:hypothetical protein
MVSALTVSINISPIPLTDAKLTTPILLSEQIMNSDSITSGIIWLSIRKILSSVKHHYAIVDEVDSVLIDDARTPLIISGPTAKSVTQQFDELKPKIEKLVTPRESLSPRSLLMPRD